MLDFEQIDAMRRRAGLSRADVYRRAEVDQETWRRTAAGITEPTSRTLKKLTKAVTELAEEKGHG